MSTEPHEPELSYIVPADRFETIATVMERIRRQTIADRIEVVIAAPSEAALAMPEEERRGFHSVKVAEVADFGSMPNARAAAIRAASAPVVAIGETHSYPDPDWAEALVEAHKGPWAVVGPSLSNANPESMLSWAGMLLDYGPFIDTTKRGEVDFAPGHNSSFKRDALMAYADRLEDVLQSDTELIAELRKRGHRLYLESRARTNHVNMTRPSTWVVERFAAGWHYAAYRSADWSRGRRLVYAVGSPLIPLVRLRRALHDLRTSGHEDLMPRLLPGLLAALILMSAGELMGYAVGMGPTRKLFHYELRRLDYVKRAPAGG